MAALRLTRKTFVEATITVKSRDGRVDGIWSGPLVATRTVTDFDGFQSMALRAMRNPLLSEVRTIVTIGDKAFITPGTCAEDYLNYVDSVTETNGVLEWAQGCRDHHFGRVEKALFGDFAVYMALAYHVCVAWKNALGNPSWLWATWDGSQLVAENGTVLA